MPSNKDKLPPLKYPDYYNYLLELPKEKYEWYLRLLYWKNRHSILNFENPKTFNEKIQWLKLYNATEFKTNLTDKILVRDYVEQKIGNKYLKQIFQVHDSFDEIDFDTLPETFYIKCNHGCKWQIFVKNKNALLSNQKAFNAARQLIKKWLAMKFFAVGGLELQYVGIKPKVFIEKVVEKSADVLTEFEIYCFNGVPKLNSKVLFTNPARRSAWDENFQTSNIRIDNGSHNFDEPPSEEIKLASKLSAILSEDIKFARVDWLLGKDGLYFNEMTFSPHSGFLFISKETDELLGSYLDLSVGK